MLNHRGKSKKRKKVNKPETFTANGPNQVWTWDITYLDSYIRGKYYKLYMIIDIFSRKIVAWEIWDSETGEHAANLVQRAVLSENLKGKPLVLHSDNGAPMKSYTLKAKLEELGIAKSYSRPRVSNDNPFSEACFKTLKYRPNFPENGFKNIEESRKWAYEFENWYNNEHYHSGINYLTPNSVHNGNADVVIKKRKLVYENARKLNPSRFNKGIRNWECPKTVSLNPRTIKKENKKIV